jgi:polar amino acid transport system permease protein
MIVRGAQGMGYAWQWAKVPRLLYRFVDGELVWGPLMKGLFVTLDIAWIAMLLTIAIGLATASIAVVGVDVGRAIAQVYIEVIRNTPLLVQILIFYFIIGRILGIPRTWAGILCLAVLRRSIRGRDHSRRNHCRAQGPSGGEPQPRTLDTRYVP